jgi:hypothetical protein
LSPVVSGNFFSVKKLLNNKEIFHFVQQEYWLGLVAIPQKNIRYPGKEVTVGSY